MPGRAGRHRFAAMKAGGGLRHLLLRGDLVWLSWRQVYFAGQAPALVTGFVRITELNVASAFDLLFQLTCVGVAFDLAQGDRMIQ